MNITLPSETLKFEPPALSADFVFSSDIAKSKPSFAYVALASIIFHGIVFFAIVPIAFKEDIFFETALPKTNVSFTLKSRILATTPNSTPEIPKTEITASNNAITSGNGTWQLSQTKNDIIEDLELTEPPKSEKPTNIKEETPKATVQENENEEDVVISENTETTKTIQPETTEPIPASKSIDALASAFVEEQPLLDELIEPAEQGKENTASELLDFIDDTTIASSPTEQLENQDVAASSVANPVASPAANPATTELESRRLDLQQLVGENATYPALAQKRGSQGDVTLQLIFDESGKLDSALVEQTSGDKLLDKAALKTAQKALRRERDANLAGQSLNIVISYRLQ